MASHQQVCLSDKGAKLMKARTRNTATSDSDADHRSAVFRSAKMRGSVWCPFSVGLLLCSFGGPVWSGRQMDKLAEKKLCADTECDHPISIAVALQDYIAPDCRFINIQRGQVVYVFSKLKGRGRLFWGGSVQGDYYGEQPARLGYFPSAVVQENQYLKPGKIEVKTSRWDFYCQ
ncbi:melanoma-derived growth regulatory protein-like [Anolis sagrei]|uniref:melanoma-derived growth regulatory protein-like n=1 Tax=Anolis sagrei TaxID=38937 RepID=UPI0035203B63